VNIRALSTLILAIAITSPAIADDTSAEIEYLLTTMGRSECTFIRNGKEYDADDAEAHLRLKYRRGKRYAGTADDFIDNLASRSSMSRKPYLIACDGKAPGESGPWLKELLAEYRASSPVMSAGGDDARAADPANPDSR
jgi:hypothetical protein